MKFELGNFLSRVEKQNQFKLYEKNKLFPFSNEDHHHHNAEFLTFSNGISAVNQKYICHLILHFPFRTASNFFFVRYRQPYRTNRFHKNYLRTFLCFIIDLLLFFPAT